jgi:hypothetical protein
LTKVKERASLPIASVPQLQTENEVSHSTASVIDNDDLYRDPDHESTVPDDSFTVIERNTQPSNLGVSRSRSSSTASSTGKPENWHPYDRPDPTYVRDKLQPLFHDDPTPDPTSETTKRRILRAFHQADYSDEGFLERGTVRSHLTTALADNPLNLNADTLERVVHAFDANRDGQFDDNEFMGLVQDLMRETAKAREWQIEATFITIVQQAKAEAATRRKEDSKFFLHWGFSSRSGPEPYYVDNILNIPVNEPPKVLKQSAFSVMAWEAKICVDKISAFEHKWIGIVPKSLQNMYLDPLRKVKSIARAFTILENQNDPHALSDLDVFLTCTQIPSDFFPPKNAKDIEKICFQLEMAKVKCGSILDLLLGFKESLGRDLDFDASGHSFKELKAWWERNRIDWRSNAVCRNSAHWSFVKDAVDTYRSMSLLADVEKLAGAVVRDYSRRALEERKKTELRSTPWAGRIRDVEISGWSNSFVSRTLGMLASPYYVAM